MICSSDCDNGVCEHHIQNKIEHEDSIDMSPDCPLYVPPEGQELIPEFKLYSIQEIASSMWEDSSKLQEIVDSHSEGLAVLFKEVKEGNTPPEYIMDRMRTWVDREAESIL